MHEVAYNLTIIATLASNHQIFAIENISITGRQTNGVEIVPNDEYDHICHKVDFNAASKQIILDIFNAQNPCRLYYGLRGERVCVCAPAGVDKKLVWSFEGAKYSRINESTGRLSFLENETAQTLFVRAALAGDRPR